MKEFLEREFEKAIILKKAFKKTEEREWNSLIVLNELMIQIGHYANVIRKNEYSIEERKNN